jgi:hypothetical protein
MGGVLRKGTLFPVSPAPPLYLPPLHLSEERLRAALPTDVLPLPAELTALVLSYATSRATHGWGRAGGLETLMDITPRAVVALSGSGQTFAIGADTLRELAYPTPSPSATSVAPPPCASFAVRLDDWPAALHDSNAR